MQTRKWAIAIIAIIVSFEVESCSNRKVTRIDPSEEIDYSGRWNSTDVKLVSKEMVSSSLQGKWLNDHLEQKNKKPVIIVGMVENKSHEHIDAEMFTNEIEKAFVTTQKVGVVLGGKKREELRAEKADQQTNSSVSSMKKFGLENGADYILQGSINSIVDSYKKNKIVYYQVDLQLTNIETNEVVWIGDKKIAKRIKN